MSGFSPDQQSSFRLLESGMNVFLTGKAGTGKTTVINEFIKRSINKHKNIIVCASTGAAAQRIEATKACTIHRAFGLRKSSIVTLPTKANEEIAAADIIVIDEISMCRIDLFEHVARAIELANELKESKELRLARKERRDPIHKKIQLVVVGDFFQLEPVLTKTDREIFQRYYKTKLFAFESRYWKKMNFANAVLTVVHRSKGDKEYTEALNIAREGEDRYWCVDWFNDNTATEAFTGPDAVILCGKNATAAEKNAARLNQLSSEEFRSMAKITGDADMASTNAEHDLRFKIGAKVMMLTNGPGYFNGSFGTVKKHLCEDGEEAVEIKIGDNDVTVKKYKWDIVKPVLKMRKVKYKEANPETGEIVVKEREEEYIETESVGSVVQFPFRLGWAITVHKSQGMTFKDCGVNLYPEFFANGQMYVALSRVDCREHIYINGLLEYKDLKASTKVRQFYSGLTTNADGDDSDGYTD